MAKKTKEELLAELERQKKAIDKHEEYMSKKTYEKKPRAIRRFERMERMFGDDDKKNQ